MKKEPNTSEHGNNSEQTDRDLGIHRRITRRDFLNGVAVGAGSALIAGATGPAAFSAETLLAAAALDEFAPEKAADYYPPARMGMRGNHDGTFTYAHLMRDGGKWDDLGKAASTGESYDLVVVGAGISGLAAAHFYRKHASADARILLL
ncbi:MAG TPA: NAD(P)-binding protein, partial [Candidatus Acidoferrum sp.]